MRTSSVLCRTLLVGASVLALSCSDDGPPAGPEAGATFLKEDGASAAELAGRREVRMRDDCEPASWNAALGEGTCVGDGGTTFDEFFEELRETGDVGAWKNDPNETGVKPGERLFVVNEGGEVHTFTRVAAFGGGIVPELNELSGNEEVAPECEQLTGEDFVAAGGRFRLTTGRDGDLLPGRHRFECCIHPWMRTVVTVRR